MQEEVAMLQEAVLNFHPYWVIHGLYCHIGHQKRLFRDWRRQRVNAHQSNTFSFCLILVRNLYAMMLRYQAFWQPASCICSVQKDSKSRSVCDCDKQCGLLKFLCDYD